MSYPIQIAQVRDFSGGVNTSELYTKIPLNQGQVATNVMLDGRGRLRPRYSCRNHTRLNTDTEAGAGTTYIAGIRLLASWDRGGTKKWAIVDSAGKLYYASGNGSVPADGSWTLDTGGSIGGDSRYCAVSYKGYLWITNKTKSVIDRTDGSTSADGGLTVIQIGAGAGEHNITVADSATAGNMEDGKIYYYKFAAGFGQSDELGIAMPSTDTLSNTLSAATAIDITLPAFSLNHANKWHIWRTYGDGDSTGPYYYVGSGAASSTFVDTYGDYELGIGIDKTENGYPPHNSACFAVHGERMWYANAKDVNDVDRPMRLFYSEIGTPDYVPSLNYIEVPGQRGDQILWIESYRGSLLVFTKNDIWAVTGSSELNFALTRIATGTSALSGFSVVNCDGLLMFVGPDGFYSCDGASVQRIATQFNLKNSSYYGNIGTKSLLSAAYDGTYGNYIVVSYDGSVGWILDLQRQAVFEINPQAGVDVYGLKGGQLFINPPDASIATREIYIACYAVANTKGCISKLDDTSGTDQGYDSATGSAETDNIDCAFTSAGVDGSDFATTKLFRHGIVQFSVQPNTASLKLYGDATALATNTTVASKMKVPGSGTPCYRMYAEIAWEAVTTTIPRLEDLAFGFTELPRRLE